MDIETKRNIQSITEDIYNINQTFESFCFIFAEIFNKPLVELSSDGFKFKEEIEKEVQTNEDQNRWEGMRS